MKWMLIVSMCMTFYNEGQIKHNCINLIPEPKFQTYEQCSEYAESIVYDFQKRGGPTTMICLPYFDYKTGEKT